MAKTKDADVIDLDTLDTADLIALAGRILDYAKARMAAEKSLALDVGDFAAGAVAPIKEPWAGSKAE
jgi:hypothetical protein